MRLTAVEIEDLTISLTGAKFTSDSKRKIEGF
jgi:hypothetical protein